ncbi:MAG: diguanylate cyclase [Chloroflexi bacterium]|nr:diguanylate cyclase [Chloroflexota bacterium]
MFDAESKSLTAGPPLASLEGRKDFEERVEADFERWGQGQGTFSVVITGLDGFRMVNDCLGSEEGDRILDRFVCSVSGLAPSVHRVGGDEFAAVLPEAGGQAAVSLAEQLRERVERALSTPIGGLSVSVGVSSCPDGAASAPEMVYGAEAAMDWAKAAGGNKVGYWTELAWPEKDVWKRRGTVPDPVTALVATLERKTGALTGQAARSAWYARKVAAALGFPEGEQALVEAAGLLHEIGKLATPSAILSKAGPLTDEEKAVVRRHPLVGSEIIARIPSLAAAAPIVIHHHEHYDGSGYPGGLRGEQIPIGSRIILVADAIDAMTTYRAYRNVVSLQTALQELQRCAGRQFDPRVVQAFVEIVSRQGLNALHWSRVGARQGKTIS